MRARSALFTLFGDVVRPAGGDAWLTTLTGCMGALGFSPEATRTALHRMAGEGWVEPHRVGRYARYRLTARGVDRLEEAAARIYHSATWDGRWRFLVGARLGRRKPLAGALRWMGFGRLSAETWVSPHDHGERLGRLLSEHGAAREALAFVTDAADGDSARDRDVVARAWDLHALRAAHRTFLERWAGDVGAVAADAEAAFATRVRLVHDWRAFLHLDPGLPHRLLPDDWLGETATGRFRRLYDTLEAPAWRFYDALVAAAPGPPAALPQAGRRAAPALATGAGR